MTDVDLDEIHERHGLDNLIKFVRARLREEEADAEWSATEPTPAQLGIMARRQILDYVTENARQTKHTRWPKRPTREGRIMIAVIKERYFVLSNVMHMLAASWRDHPDYHPEWTPQWPL